MLSKLNLPPDGAYLCVDLHINTQWHGNTRAFPEVVGYLGSMLEVNRQDFYVVNPKAQLLVDCDPVSDQNSFRLSPKYPSPFPPFSISRTEALLLNCIALVIRKLLSEKLNPQRSLTRLISTMRTGQYNLIISFSFKHGRAQLHWLTCNQVDWHKPSKFHLAGNPPILAYSWKHPVTVSANVASTNLRFLKSTGVSSSSIDLTLSCLHTATSHSF